MKYSFNMYIDHDLKIKLLKLSELKNVSVSEYISMLLIVFINKEKTDGERKLFKEGY